jgi:hypothetical protein
MSGINQLNAESDQEAQSWQLARQVSNSIKPLPIAFTSSVRLLICDQLGNKGTIRPVTKFQVARIFRSNSFKAMLYYATKDLYPAAVKDKPFVSTGDMMALYSPADLASLIGMYVMYKKVRRLVDEQEWKQFKYDLNKQIFIGGQIGISIPKIGVGAGILTASMALLSLATLYSAEPKAFANYRRQLQKNSFKQDPKQEIEIWGCSSLQIATLNMSILGYGVEVSEALMKGLESARSFHKLNNPMHLDYYMARLWLHTFWDKQKQPNITIPGDYYPLEADRVKSVSAIDGFKESDIHWFERNAEDVEESKTPQLFNKAEVNEEVPEELQEVFSMDEITAMEENDFDDLIDQIDLEQAGEVKMGGEKLSVNDVNDLDKAI